MCRHQQEHVTFPHNHGAAESQIFTKFVASRVTPGSLRFACRGAATLQQISCCVVVFDASWPPHATASQLVRPLSSVISLGKPSQPLACPPCTIIRLQLRQPRQRSHGIGTADLLLHPRHVMMNNTRSSAQGKAARSRFGLSRDKLEALRMQSAKILTPCPQDEQVIIIHE